MHTFHSKSGPRILLAIIVVMFIVGFYLVLEKSPMVPEQEWAQKIFYYHVPSAWTAFLGYFMVMIAGIQYLRTKDIKWDRIGLASAEIGTLFCILVLITGPIWAKPIWGTPWNWEPRLTTTLILFLIYVGYFMLRQFGGNYERVAKNCAVLGIIAFVDVPIIFVSVKFWAPEVQSHPQVEMAKQPGDILGIFLLSLLAFTLLFVYLIMYRNHILFLEDELRKKKNGV